MSGTIFFTRSLGLPVDATISAGGSFAVKLELFVQVAGVIFVKF